MELNAVRSKENKAAVSEIVPEYGPETGKNIVMIVGNGFSQNYATECRFGNIGVSPAKFISNESIECVAPQKNTGQMMQVDLVVSVNGFDLIGKQKYTYLPIVSKTWI